MNLDMMGKRSGHLPGPVRLLLLQFLADTWSVLVPLYFRNTGIIPMYLIIRNSKSEEEVLCQNLEAIGERLMTDY